MTPEIPEIEKPQAAVQAIYNKQDARKREKKRGIGSMISAGQLQSRANTQKSSLLGSVGM
jgi:hypothetical protein